MNPDRPNVETLFHQALEVESDERAAFLTGACGSDATLRQRVEALLAAHDTAQGFLPDGTAEGTPPLRPGALPPERPGTIIGRYKLLEQLGEGGFGVVWAAEQREPIRRRVALKIIKLGMDTKQVIARFEAERQALALMDHPNIAKVLDAGATDTGRPYFVMELVRGIPITKYCEHEQLSIRDRLDLFIKTCHAIQHAHQKGVIHRDIKPSNVMVTLHDGVPIPKVIDFGIAKATQAELTEKTIYTQLHQFIGTPAYMSPEQADMSGLDIDTRSDIYSLGVLLYELLTGKTPFDEKTLLRAGLDEMRRIIREQEPLRPSTKLSQTRAAVEAKASAKSTLHVPYSAIDRDLDWIVMKCLEKDRTRRYETANGLATDLKRHVNNETVVARPPTRLYLFQKVVRRNKLAFVAAGAVAAALLVGLALSTWLFLRERAALEIAGANALRAERQAQRAEQKAEESRRNLYAADMILAQTALEAGNTGHADELLRKYLPHNGDKDLRGWEWRYAWAQSRSDELFTLDRGHIVTSLALAPDGRTLASGSLDESVVLWDLAKRQPITTLVQSYAIGCVAFSNDGKELIVGTFDGRLAFWNCETWQQVTTLSNLSPVRALKVSPNGRSLATIGSRFLTIWTLPDRQEVARFPVKHDTFNLAGLAFSPDSSLLAYSKGDGTIVLWDLANTVAIAELKGHVGFVCSLVFSPTGSLLVSGGLDQTVRVWDMTSRKELKRVDTFSGWVSCVEFSPDGEVLAVAGADQRTKLLETRTWSDMNTLKGHSNEVWALVFGRDGRTIFTGSKDTTIKCWAVLPPNRFNSQGLLPDVSAAVLLPGAKNIYLTHTNQTYSLCRSDPFEETGRYPFPVSLLDTDADATPLASATSPDGKLLLAATTNGVVKIFDHAKQQFVGELLMSWSDAFPLAPTISGLAFSPNGLMVAGVATDRTCRLWAIAGGREGAPIRSEISSFAISSRAVKPPRFSRSGRLLGIALHGGAAEIWNVSPAIVSAENATSIIKNANAEKVATLFRDRWHFADIGFSRDDSTAVTASLSGRVTVWNLQTAREVAVLGGQLNSCFSVALSPDDSRLAACGGDGTVKLWDTGTFQEVASLKIHDYPLYQLAFPSDGESLVVVAANRIFVLRAPKDNPR